MRCVLERVVRDRGFAWVLRVGKWKGVSENTYLITLVI